MDSPDDVVPTRLVDLSGLGLTDLQRSNDARLSQAGESLAREVSASVVVSIAGSDS